MISKRRRWRVIFSLENKGERPKFAFLLSFLILWPYDPSGSVLIADGIRDIYPYQDILKHHVSVTLKLVQVYVNDEKGNPVANLEKEDFELYDDGDLVKITEFERHGFSGEKAIPITKDGASRPVPKASPESLNAPLIPRKFLLFFDFAYNSAQGIARAKIAALHFIRTDLRPEDEVGLFSFSMMRGLVIHEVLTAKHEAVEKAIESISLKESAGRADEIEEEYWRRQESESGKVGKSYTQINAERQETKLQALYFIQKMTDLAKALRYVPGQKNILFFSTGIPGSLIQGNRMNTYIISSKGGLTTGFDLGDSTMIQKSEIMLKEFAAANCSIYAFDTREAALVSSIFSYDSQTFEENQRRDIFTQRGAQKSVQLFKEDPLTGFYTLSKSARETGGAYFSNINEYEHNMDRVQAITKSYYVLGYYIREATDGRFHKLGVKIKKKGYQVRAQTGYYNPRSFRDYSTLEKRLHLIDLALSSTPKTSVLIQARMSNIVFTEGAENKVTLFTEITPEIVRILSGRKIEIVSLIFDENENIVATERSETGLREYVGRGSIYVTEMSLDLGHYGGRLVLRDMDTGESVVASTEINVPNWTKPGLNVSTPLVLAGQERARFLSTGGREQRYKWTEYYRIDPSRFAPAIGGLPINTSTFFIAFGCSWYGLVNPNINMVYQLINSSTGKSESIQILNETINTNANLSRRILEVSTENLRPGTHFFSVKAEDIVSKSFSSAQTPLVIQSK